jgi:hypothetical protein
LVVRHVAAASQYRVTGIGKQVGPRLGWGKEANSL